MDKIKQYYQITNVKPEYYVLISSYFKPSRKRIIFNGKELELHYNDEFKIYLEDELHKFSRKENLIGASEEVNEKNLVLLII